MGIDKADIRKVIHYNLAKSLENLVQEIGRDGLPAGYLEAGTPIYAEYELRPLVPMEEILDRFQGERRGFLSGVFRQAKKAKIWSRLDLEAAAQALGAPRDRLVRALDYLAEQGLLEVRAAGLRHPYRWLRPPPGLNDLDEMARTLHQYTLERETREIARLDQVLTLAAHDGCQTAFLAAHFGERLPHPCGHCSWCVRERRQAREAPPAIAGPPGRSEPAPRGGPPPGDPGAGPPASPRPLPDRPPLPPHHPRQAQIPSPLRRLRPCPLRGGAAAGGGGGGLSARITAVR